MKGTFLTLTIFLLFSYSYSESCLTVFTCMNDRTKVSQCSNDFAKCFQDSGCSSKFVDPNYCWGKCTNDACLKNVQAEFPYSCLNSCINAETNTNLQNVMNCQKRACFSQIKFLEFLTQEN
jgi:hypothetical protein